MADFAPQMFYFKFHKGYEEVMSSLNKESVPKRLIEKIKDYFDYVWTSSKGISYSEFLNELPKCLNADILSSRYTEAIENSLIFKDAYEKVDHALANSILTRLEYRVYMDGDFVVIGGSTSRNTYIIMEGEATVFGLNEEFMSVIRSGGHYSNDLEEGDEDILKYKRPLHIVSAGISIVGILNYNDLHDLYVAYPDLKKKLRILNKQFVRYSKKFCKKYLESMNVEYSIESMIEHIADNYSYSTHLVYDGVRDKAKSIDLKSEEIKKYDIINKQRARLRKTNTIRRSNHSRGCSSIDFVNDKIFLKDIENNSCWSRLKFNKNSTNRRIIDLVNLLNLLYIAISIPLFIAFNIKMEWYLILLELLSLCISGGVIFINIRTPVIMRGGTTLEFKKVMIYYYHNGLILDIIALWPFNLILGAADIVEPIWIIPIIRLIRVFTVWKIMHIFGRFELYFKKYNILMQVIKAMLFLSLTCHFAGCLWFWFNFYGQPDKDTTWMEFNGLDHTQLYRKVLLSYYTIINIVATVGYGDMFPMTDAERLFFVFLINMGDAVFAVAFGLIAGISMQASKNRSTDEFFKKMHSIKELLRQSGGEVSQKVKVEQFFAYSWHLQKSTNMVSIRSLSSQLPYRLSKEVVYYSTKHLLEPMFKQFGSENLIKDVSKVLKQTIYLPGDLIILKDDIGDEMYFIAEGVVYILAADKRTVLNTLNKGAFFGEMAIFLGLNKRTAYVQAETFCSLLILKKSDLDNIKVNYPTVAKDIRKEAKKRAEESRDIVQNNDDDRKFTNYDKLYRK